MSITDLRAQVLDAVVAVEMDLRDIHSLLDGDDLTEEQLETVASSLSNAAEYSNEALSVLE